MFESPSAFSIFFKRMVTPGRKADDGWKTVKFQGKFLDHYKMELARRREGASDKNGAGGWRRCSCTMCKKCSRLVAAAHPVQKPSPV